MKNKKGFTLVELLAVIVILAIILTIATTNVIKSIDDSKEKARFIAAKEIVQMAEAYFAKNGGNCVDVKDLYNDYLEGDVTNPKTENAENVTNPTDLEGQEICICTNCQEQTNYSDNNDTGYEFDGYEYNFN